MKNLKAKTIDFLKSERGDISVKGIAIMVATIVIIGAGMAIIKGNLSTWIDYLWGLATESIEGFM